MTLTPVARVTQELKGQTLYLPNLKPYFSQWPTEISPYYEQLKVTIESKIQEWISPVDERVRLKARKVDLPLFCATWYPRSTLDRLETMAWFSMWLFLWDDVIESTVVSTTSAPTNDVAWLHDQALTYVAFHLGLSESVDEPPPPTKYCTLFKHAGPALRAECTIAERQRFHDEIRYYMKGCEVEQTYVRAGELPTLHAFWENRIGTSSVNMYCSLGEYMAGTHIPAELYETEELKTMWFELNRHISAMNDIVSLKKEIGKSLHSLIPVIINETGVDVNTAVGAVIETLRTSAENVDQGAKALLRVTAHDPKAHASVQKYVMAYWTNMTGSYWWS
ncbi:isoprenoid synthase domain-containing protein [Podospora didyma]|uniref:Terpene synthase n=1 Tax=Podospora didyma TaxID=330526 RepID=A0AAE0NG81_9PEZI|nr:isoprenoid synthase domain-containing protein [Podospora didyma]